MDCFQFISNSPMICFVFVYKLT